MHPAQLPLELVDLVAQPNRHLALQLLGRLAHLLLELLDPSSGSSRPGDVDDSQADSSRLRALSPDLAPVPLPEGPAKTGAWLASAG